MQGMRACKEMYVCVFVCVCDVYVQLDVGG